MSRKRRKRRPNWGPLIWLLVVVNVIAGLLFSPLTGATYIRVMGAKSSDEPRLTQELQWLKDKPCLVVNGSSVEDVIMRRPDVKSAELTRNVFGRGELRMSYYLPVALVAGTTNVVLTDGGFLCAVPDPMPELPKLDLFGEAWRPSLGVSSAWEPEKVAEVCERATNQGIIKNLSISVSVSGSVCLNSGETGRVILGAPDDLDLKFADIEKLLQAQPELLDQHKELVLISPSQPVTRPLEASPL